MSGVEELYKQFGILADAKEKAGEHEGAFLAILAAVKGSQAEKRLASQFIARFFKYFPKLQENAIDAMLDLCEDEDNMIRRQAIKGLPDLCKDTPEHLPRIADVLTQLLQSEDPTELTIVKNALTSLFKMEPKGTIGGLFSQILNGEEVSRESAINFLSSVVEEYGKAVLHPSQETEEFLVEEIKKAMADVTGEEFRTFMKILSSLKVMANAHQELAGIVAEQVELTQAFQPTDADVVDRFLSCARQALPYFVKGASAQAFFSYIVESILPKLNELVSSDGDDIKLEMLKLCAEMSPHGLTEENVKASIEPIYNLLLEYMPLPPGEEEENKTEENAEPKLQFSCVECLIFTFHQLAKKSPGFLTDASAADRLKDFRLRLQYFAQGCQVYIKQLRLSLQGKTGVALQEDENKIKIVALRTTSNINALIKDLFHNPPSFKSTVTLSWKTPAKNQPTTPVAKKENTNTVDEKRKRAGITPITFDLPPETKSPKKTRGSTVTVYTPPGRRTGASNGVLKGQSMPNGNRGRGGFRGRNRGRGRGWRGGRF
ncbi:apoptosis inhibitor 5-like [Acropora millepora]|uniref:apoptosis inhibitor 5-like n=1 Tax=Acropora millepora TaxID=45264 RepID=UPI0010FC673F|nr:apoptosis inhibitor 5-like [Acropora millepora]